MTFIVFTGFEVGCKTNNQKDKETKKGRQKAVKIKTGHGLVLSSQNLLTTTFTVIQSCFPGNQGYGLSGL